MKLSRRAYLLIGLVAVAASVSVIVYAAVSQTFPATTIPPLNFATTQNCSGVIDESTPAATSGTLIFNCASSTSSGGIAAFTVNRDGSSTPTYTITSSGGILTTSLAIAPDGSGCTSGMVALTSGTAVSFTASGAWIYCLSYTANSSGGTINSFSVSWTP
jgi:hypothetical protein